MLSVLRKHIVKKIENYYLQNYQRKAVVIPSGRLGIYVIAKLLFKPGDKVIISPITCKTVIYALLSAQVFPIFVDIDLSSGNIDAEAIPATALAEAKGIVTTNLYGTPDNALKIKELADHYDLIMIEDCAQVLDSYVENRRIGTIGDVSLFSFKKFFDIPGGVICPRDDRMIEEMTAIVKRESYMSGFGEEMARLGQLLVMKHYLTAKEKLMKHFSNNSKPVIAPPKGDPDLPGEKQNDRESGAATIKYDTQLGKSNPYYRKFPTIASLIRLEKCLQRAKEIIERRAAQNQWLISQCPLEFKRPSYDVTACHLTVPFFSERRDDIKMKLMNRCGIPTWYIYNPPLDKLFASILNSTDNIRTERAELWSQMILPINSEFADEYLGVIHEQEN